MTQFSIFYSVLRDFDIIHCYFDVFILAMHSLFVPFCVMSLDVNYGYFSIINNNGVSLMVFSFFFMRKLSEVGIFFGIHQLFYIHIIETKP